MRNRVVDKLHYITKNGFKVRPTHDNKGKYCVEIVDEFNLLYKKKINQGEYKHTTNSFAFSFGVIISFVLVYHKYNQ